MWKAKRIQNAEEKEMWKNEGRKKHRKTTTTTQQRPRHFYWATQNHGRKRLR